MVLRRTIEDLRERPHEERTALAASIAIGVVAVLLVGWLIYFFHSIGGSSAPGPAAAETGVASSTDQNGLQESGSTTQFIETQGNLQLEQIGTTSTSTQSY
jgi:hypothetical protein